VAADADEAALLAGVGAATPAALLGALRAAPGGFAVHLGVARLAALDAALVAQLTGTERRLFTAPPSAPPLLGVHLVTPVRVLAEEAATVAARAAAAARWGGAAEEYAVVALLLRDGGYRLALDRAGAVALCVLDPTGNVLTLEEVPSDVAWRDVATSTPRAQS